MLYESDVKADPRLEPSTVYVRVSPLATLRRTRPDVFKIGIRRITAGMVEAYMADYERGKGPYHLSPKAKADPCRQFPVNGEQDGFPRKQASELNPY